MRDYETQVMEKIIYDPAGYCLKVSCLNSVVCVSLLRPGCGRARHVLLTKGLPDVKTENGSWT